MEFTFWALARKDVKILTSLRENKRSDRRTEMLKYVLEVIVLFYLTGVLTGLLFGLISQRKAIEQHKKINHDEVRLREAFLEEVDAEIRQGVPLEA